MKIVYSEKEKTIKIKDGLKWSYFMIKIMLILNITNGMVWVYMDNSRNCFTNYIDLFHTKKINFWKTKFIRIVSLEEKQFLGRIKISLKLKNGKSRDLTQMKSQSEISEIKKMFENIGIKTTWIKNFSNNGFNPLLSSVQKENS